MNINIDEIRMLLGICVRGIRDLRDSETEDLKDSERMELSEIADKLSDLHWDLHPWAPDVESLDEED